MGRATRWLRSLCGGKSMEKSSGNGKQKSRWRNSGDPSGKAMMALSSPEVTETRTQSYRDALFAEAEKERSMHALAVAAATAAAADAAIAAAQAAAAVVKLTSQGRNAFCSSAGSQWRAAVTIQTMFRAFLARRAMRALKGLVKFQAHVRGYLVRREAAKTLHSMQALLRAQAANRMRRAHSSPSSKKFHGEPRRRRHVDKLDKIISENVTSTHRTRVASSVEHGYCFIGAESPKMVEIGTIRQKSWPHQIDPATFESLKSRSPCKQSPRLPPAISASSVPHGWTDDWDVPGNEWPFANGQSTPRLTVSDMQDIHAAPTKRVTDDDEMQRRHSGRPHFQCMANAKASRAKPRPQSARKLDVDPIMKKMFSLQEADDVRTSLSERRTHRPCSPVLEAISFKTPVLNRLDRSPKPGRSPRLDRHYLASPRAHLL